MKAVVDDSLVTANVAKQKGLVDHLVSMDDLTDMISDEIGHKVDLISRLRIDPA